MQKLEFDVRAWLKSFDMDVYAPNFINNGFKSLMVCSHLNEEDLRAVGITLRGHIKDILLHSQDLKDSNFLFHCSVPCITSPPRGLPKVSISTPNLQIEESPREQSLQRGVRKLTQSYHKRAKLIPLHEQKHNAKIEYLLIRHGESEANVNPELYSTVADHAVRLSPQGEQQAKEAGKQVKQYFEANYKLTPDWKCRIWTSTYKRARQTAEFIKQEAGEWVTDIKENMFLVEQQFGLFEGVDWANGSVDEIFPQELAHYNKCATFGGRFWARVPMGESRFDVCRRVYHTLGPIRDDGIDHVIIVSHGVTLRAFVMCYFNKTPEWFEEEPNPTNCSIKLITKTNDEKYIWPEEGSQKSTVPDSDLLLLKEEINQIRNMLNLMNKKKADKKKET
jgi:broad specificity phosphatase PhoE